MPRPFSAATAEQVAAVVEAVVVRGGDTAVSFVAEFTDLQPNQAEAALALAADLGLVKSDANASFSISNPISRLLRTPHEKEKAAVFRIMLEMYQPFTIFREELEAAGNASTAATRTKTRLELDAHREDIRSTLLNLATYSGALIAGHGGKYERDSKGVSSLLAELAAGSTEEAAALHQVRTHLGGDVANAVSHENVLVPLAAALRHAAGQNAREAVVHAGNAVETFLDECAGRLNVNLGNATGINSKLERFQNQGALPSKLVFNGKYLGHIRNAADHGIDAAIGSP